MHPVEIRLRPTGKKFPRRMLRSARLKSGRGFFCAAETSRSYRASLRDTGIRPSRWERTRTQEQLERLGSLPLWLLCNSHIANLIDRLEVTPPVLLQVRWHARRRAQEIAPRDVRSQEMRREPLFPRG